MVASLVATVCLAAPAGADAASDNTVSAFGSAPFLGPQSAMKLASPLVGMAATPAGDGYWAVAADGGIFTFGNAPFLGSMGGTRLNKPIVGMTAAPTGLGYWLVASDGGIFNFGSASFLGSMGGSRLNKPIVGMTAMPKAGPGYWLVASDGGIFAFGHAPFLGSTGGIKLNQPVVGMAASASGAGYWLAASDGGIFAYGDARFVGSAASEALQAPVVGMAASFDGAGYWLAQRDGQVSAFGVPDHSASAGTGTSTSSEAPTVAIAASPQTDGYWLVRGQSPVFAVASSGPEVQAVQQRLMDLGYWLGNVNGVYGDLTTQAVYAFQKTNSLPVTGKVDTATASALGRAGRPTPKHSGDLVEVDKTRQVAFIVRSGRALWTFNVSTGTEKPYTFEGQRYLADTPTGTFTISRQVDGYDKGPLGRLYRPKYFHPDGIALHGYTEVPPYPASHGCVRFTNAGIDFIWNTNLALMGTTVFVYGTSPTR